MHLIAPSNSSILYHPENTLTDYTIQLPKELVLSGKYEIGLEEISFPQSWYNTSEGMEVGFENVIRGFSRDFVKIPAGYYRSPEAFAKSVNRVFEEIERSDARNSLEPCDDDDGVTAGADKKKKKKKKKSLRLAYSQQDNRMLLHVPRGTTTRLTPDAATVLGFSTTGPFQSRSGGELKVWGTKPPNLHSNLRTLQVHCDLAAPHPVGDEILPLLRTVQVPTEYSTFVVTKTYSDIHYYPVARNSVAKVRVYMRDEAGLPVPFEYGKVIVTLHLRRQTPSS